MPECLDLTGQVFGQLTARRLLPKDGKAKRYWECLCTCGMVCVILGDSLRSGKTQSCGCLQRERTSKANTTHGLSSSSEYIIYKSILNRCTNPHEEAYKNYGGRGIYCEWASFEAFYADMGPRPSPELTIERINNNGPYSADNCMWATRAQQGLNSRHNHLVSYYGELLPLSEIARRSGRPISTIHYRAKHGIPMEAEAMTWKTHQQSHEGIMPERRRLL